MIKQNRGWGGGGGYSSKLQQIDHTYIVLKCMYIKKKRKSAVTYLCRLRGVMTFFQRLELMMHVSSVPSAMSTPFIEKLYIDSIE